MQASENVTLMDKLQLMLKCKGNCFLEKPVSVEINSANNSNSTKF